MTKNKPGVIYELRFQIDDEWTPFYVGESSNHRMRMVQHRAAAVTGDTYVYTFIREVLVPKNIKWEMFEVLKYGEEGPSDLEDEHIMNLLQQDMALTNMKKGNANWMKNMMEMAADMKARKITSYRQYRKVKEQESLDEMSRVAEEKHAEWLRQEVIERAKGRAREEHHKKQAVENAKSYVYKQRAKKMIDEIKAKR